MLYYYMHYMRCYSIAIVRYIEIWVVMWASLRAKGYPSSAPLKTHISIWRLEGLFDNFFADLAMARTGWGMVQGSARPSSESVIEISSSELTPPPAQHLAGEKAWCNPDYCIAIHASLWNGHCNEPQIHSYESTIALKLKYNSSAVSHKCGTHGMAPKINHNNLWQKKHNLEKL